MIYRPNILIAHGDRDIREGLVTSLSKLHVEIHQAETAAEALTIIKAHDVECLICPVELTFIEDARAITDLPIIAIVSPYTRESVNLAVKHGVQDFLEDVTEKNAPAIIDAVCSALIYGKMSGQNNPEFQENDYIELLKKK